ncbi:helix-turn-helix transcriptional regulator [Brevibacillus composti]|uniref:Helix-turn-helix transcriptional regulator n=1 Tax=Brevibacillus composti TaxID=2796470 RepID=A0A7T5JNR9_9BACL|nr:helix-turn-helix domain-containing protein [Brevibacillus composti]QQE74401.1 helix-turn-helix transcriptional regulator [Brevibacillus composti]QUO41483.1 helix-turn-helix transcriptional regulator [Brevibacillus composti]
MGESVSTLQFTTIGDVIKKYREQSNQSISLLAKVSGVSKGVISKVESGETKRPELKTIMPIAKTLGIPIAEIIEHYIEIDERPDVLLELIHEAIQLTNIPLVTKVALRFLQTSYEESHVLIERLYNFVVSLTDKSYQLPLYDVIIKYARERGMQRFLARGLMQKFLLQMHDLEKLEESFRLGEEALHYTDFLDQEERVNLYYQMAFQAHDLKKYEKCIEFGKMGHAEDTTNNETKERVAWAICNSYFRMNNILGLEEHLRMYEELGYRFVIERLKYYKAIILSNKEQYDEAIPLLRECVSEATKINRLHRVNILMETLLKINATDAIRELIEHEENNFVYDFTTPYNFSELGRYFRQKAAFYINQGSFDDGVEAYLQSMHYFAKINSRKDIMECSEEILTLYHEQGKDIKLDLLGRIKEVYNNVNKVNFKE